LKLTDSQREDLDRLFEFVLTLVVKDEWQAEANETVESARLAYEYMDAILGVDGRTEAERQLLISSYVEPNPYYKKLQDDHGISPFEARSAKNFQILSYERFILPQARYAVFLDEYYKVMRYFTAVLYTKAFESDLLYPNFCRLYITMMAILRYLDASMDQTGNIDFLSSSALENMLKSHGLGILTTLPAVYQRKVLKNLTELIRFKGTTTAIERIVDLFGFSGVFIYRHYLFKDYPRDEAGAIVDWSSPDIRFLKIRHDAEDVEREIPDAASDSYDFFTGRDPYWQCSREELLAKDFNLLATKYISIGSTLDFVGTALELSYFRTLINRIETTGIPAHLQFLNEKISAEEIKVYDALIAAQILVTRFLGFNDTIITSETGVATVYGYSFDQADKFEIDGVSDVVDPATLPKADEQAFIETYRRNNIYRRAFERITAGTQDYETYKELARIHKVKFIAQYQSAVFDGFATYSAYLLTRNPDLHKYVEEALVLTEDQDVDVEATRNIIVDRLSEIVTSLDNYLDLEDGALNIFASANSALVDQIKVYMRQVVQLFKSYTVDLRDFVVTYMVKGDPFNTGIHWRERKTLTSELWKADDASEHAYDRFSIIIPVQRGTIDHMVFEDELWITSRVRKRDDAAFSDDRTITASTARADLLPLSDDRKTHGFFQRADGLTGMHDTFTITVIP
jgi:hypothetical protein